MDESTLSITDVREDFMVSPVGDSKPALRIGHFLKPPAEYLDGEVSEILSSSMTMPLPRVFEPKEWPLVIHFSCWGRTNRKWVEWVDTLQLRYESVWKKVGIFEAIMSTKCSILKNKNLCLGVAEKWCPETNTFLFPWGEATITLEDVMVLGGYPLVGDPVFTTLESLEMKEVEKKLIHARQEPWMKRKGKASLSVWMDLFMKSGSEIEHEAFLATWLSMVGFSHNSLVSKFVFPIVVHLARGNTIALGPAVLAGIYKDLSLLKKTIVGLTENLYGDKSELEKTLHSPFYLVQIWVWERFMNLQPQPRWINHKEPMLCRWHKVKALKIDNVRLALNSAMEDFRWRPYVQHACKFKVFYPENETLVPFETNLDKELVSYVTCLRASLLVGIQSTTEQYLPHRVAMQFGMDQDVPACVTRFNWTKEIAWKNYCRAISDRNLYFPARLFEGDVTTSYAKWWKESVLSHLDFAKIVKRKRSMKRKRRMKPLSDFLPKHLKTGPSGSSVQDGLEDNENIDADVPKKCKNFSNQSSAASSVDYENVKKLSSQTKSVAKDTVESLVGGLEEDFEELRLSSERVSLPSSQVESYSFAPGITVMDLEQRINRLQTVIKNL